MEKSTYQDVLYEVDGPAAVITINRVLCDLSIAAEHARFGLAGPRVGSFDGGFGSAYLARVVGEKRAREIWPAAKAWVNQPAQYSPIAIRFLKHSFNADTDHQGGLSQMSQAGLDVFSVTDEAKEGAADAAVP